MPPQQPYSPPPQFSQPQTPQPNMGQYDFIMSPQQPKRPGVFGNTKLLLFVVGIAAVLIVIIAIILSAASGNKGNAQPLIAVAERQQEIIRVANLAYPDLGQQSVKNFVQTTKLSLATDKSELLAYLGKNSIKVSEKQLSAGQNSSIDTALTNAKATSTVDSTAVKVITELLEAYQADIKQAYTTSSNPTTSNLLNEFYGNAGLLLQQAKQQ